MFLYFPFLHAELVSGTLPEGISLLNPGLATTQEKAFTPADLPLEPKSANRYVAESLAFGENFSRPGDMAAAMRADAGRDDESGTAIRGALSRIENERAKDAPDAARANAQATLLFAYAFEERLIELNALSEDIKVGMGRLRASLGLDDEMDDEERTATADLVAASEGDEARREAVSSWRIVLRAMLALVPEAQGFVSFEQAVREDLEEEGVKFAELPSGAFGLHLVAADVPVSVVVKGIGSTGEISGSVRILCPA
ncbi:hypothetical protein dsat_0928 [Alkalidesulfovibrio alkalitolerans DSM 16529]|uniref:Uncharacterized protein n=1 Tax=Alkalidesulfovibrio alkalitolerans DSM 16529 TaxID=1121439 RepID=S7UCL2_9BACT|nr:hypothetical protein [Alkalidesulfovibrio alkalitolerans]EPR31604.1 hypothetical protein dsat_0928 [Alkalidesulfovibrio alkalitolerans DSM 16529]